MTLGISTATKTLSTMIKSPEVIAVGTAILLVPLLQPTIDSFIAKIPFLNRHRTLALIVIGVVIFFLASKVGSPTLRAVVIGLAATLFIVGLAPIINQFVRR